MRGSYCAQETQSCTKSSVGLRAQARDSYVEDDAVIWCKKGGVTSLANCGVTGRARGADIDNAVVFCVFAIPRAPVLILVEVELVWWPLGSVVNWILLRRANTSQELAS